MKHKNEIFENFYKIAIEKGIVNKTQDDFAKANSKATSILEKTKTHSSLSVKDIEKLFDAPPTSKGMEYKNNIMEIAHKTPAVVFTSHDKINSLVENNIERQNIILNILNKKQNSQLMHEKYAKNTLATNLAKLANFFDSKNDELTNLADISLQQISIQKVAFAPALLIIPAVPAVIGALYAQQHLDGANQGFKLNSDKLISEIDDLINSNSNYGIGYSFTPNFTSNMNIFKEKLTDISETVLKSLEVISDLEKPKTVPELMELVKNPNTSPAFEAFKTLQSKVSETSPMINKILINFKSEAFKSRQMQEKGVMTELLDRAKFLHGGNALLSDDFDDVRMALVPYNASLIEILYKLKEAQNVSAKAKEELSAVEAPSETQGTPKPQTTESKPSLQEEQAKDDALFGKI